MSIDDLEAGLQVLGSPNADHGAFWEENIPAFRQTVLLAIRETSEALMSPDVSSSWRVLLENQLESLVQYLELANRYGECRPITLEPTGFERATRPERPH